MTNKGRKLKDTQAMREQLYAAAALKEARQGITLAAFADWYNNHEQDPRLQGVSATQADVLITIYNIFQHLPMRYGNEGIERLLATLTITEARELIGSYFTEEDRVTLLELVEDGKIPNTYTYLHNLIKELRTKEDFSAALQTFAHHTEDVQPAITPLPEWDKLSIDEVPSDNLPSHNGHASVDDYAELDRSVEDFIGAAQLAIENAMRVQKKLRKVAMTLAKAK